MRRFLLFLVCFLSVFISSGKQNLPYSYAFLESKVENLKEKPSEQLQYIRKMIIKSKEENDIKKLHRAYSLASTYTRGALQLKYGDSLLITAFKQNDTDIIGDCYLAKGSILMNEEKYTAALDNYMTGYEYIKKKKNLYLVNNAEYLIAQTKIYLKQYKDANNILKGVVSFYRENHPKIGDTDYSLYYLYSLIAYIDTNSHLGKFKDNENLISEGINFINENKYHDYLCYFLSLEGTDAFFQKKYDYAIEKLTEALRLYDDNWKHLTDVYYIGMSYWEKGNKDEALKYLLKIDNEYVTNKKLDPQFRPAIERLVDYYKDKDNSAKQLEYINHLRALDKLYEKDYQELYPALTKVYDTKKLNEAKIKLEKDLQTEKRIRIIVIILSVLIVVSISWLAYRYYHRQKFYKKLYAQMYATTPVNDTKTENSENSDIQNSVAITKIMSMDKELSEMNPLVIENILTYLDNFEADCEYLKQDVSLRNMSIECCTNKSYLSKIVNHYKNDHFNSYVNTLRLKYIVNEWKIHPATRNLPICDIAKKIGFGTAQSFSRNFKEMYNISPTYFLKKLDKTTGV